MIGCLLAAVLFLAIILSSRRTGLRILAVAGLLVSLAGLFVNGLQMKSEIDV